MGNKLGIHCYISGRVQGVWFRASACKEAQQLGLTGWARNLPDGRVEVMAFGESAQLEKLYKWLQRGPLLAKVTDITREDLAWQVYEGFKAQ